MQGRADKEVGVVKGELVRASERQAAKSGGRRDEAVERGERSQSVMLVTRAVARRRLRQATVREER